MRCVGLTFSRGNQNRIQMLAETVPTNSIITLIGRKRIRRRLASRRESPSGSGANYAGNVERPGVVGWSIGVVAV